MSGCIYLIVISYDAHTYHSVQAAINGCLSIVLRKNGMSTADFRSHSANGLRQYGIAYGFMDIPRALLTRNKLLKALRDVEALNLIEVRTFLSRVKKHWEL